MAGSSSGVIADLISGSVATPQGATRRRVREQSGLLRLLALLTILTTAQVHAELMRSQSWELGVSSNGRAEFLTGLPQVSALALAKDQAGFLWVGTQNGLARFDGSNFQIFDSVSTNALGSSWINALFVDAAGRLWIATTEEIAIYTDRRFRRITGPGEAGTTTGFSETSDGKIWLAGESLRYIDGEQVKIANFYSGAVIDVVALNDELIFLTEDHRLFAYDDQQLTELDRSLWQNSALKGLWRYQEYLLLLTDDAAIRISRGSYGWQSQRLPFPDNVADQILAVSEEQVFAVARGGSALELRDIETAPHWHPVAMPAPPSSNLEPKVALLEPGPTLWIGTQASGLWNVWSNGIEHEASDQAISNTFAWSFFVSDTVYVATDAGVFQRQDTDNWTLIIPSEKLDNNVAYSYWEDQTGQFVGTRAGLYVRGNDAQAFVRHALLGNRQINSIVEEDGQLWLTTSAGLYVRKVPGEPFELVEGSASLAVRAIIKDANDTLWLGTESGVYSLTGSSLKRAESPLLDSVFVTAMSQLGDDWIAVGSYGEGLFLRDPQGGWRQYKVGDGLPFPNVFSLNLIGDWLWSSSDKGLIRLDKNALIQGQIKADVVMRDDGAFQGRSRLRCCNGAGHRRSVVFEEKLFLPTLEGVLSVALNTQEREAVAPVITSVWQGAESLELNDPLMLTKEQRDLEITFSTPHLASGELPEFRYRMGSEEEDWVYTSARRTAFFTNIASGESVFELQSRLGASDWLSAEPLRINVQPYFYETWTARLLLLLVIAGIISQTVHYRTKKLRERAQELEAAVEEATQALKDTARDGLRLIQEANAPIVTLTEDGSVLGWNRSAEQLSGFGYEEVLHKKITSVLPDAQPRIDPEGLFRRLHRGDSIEALRLSFSNREGRRITLIMGGTMLPASKEQPERVVLVGQDLTEYLEREQQLVQASKMSTLGEMAAGMAHELNQPLTIIRLALINITTIIDKKPEKMDQVPAKLARINEQVDRAAKIINHMRRFGRRAEMPGSGDYERFEPEAAISSAANLFREQLRLDNISLDTEFAADDAVVNGDPLLLEQVIMNLLSNARDAIKEHTAVDAERRVLITTSLDAETFTVSVEDNGGGASESALRSMFEPFFTTKEPGKGTGLGLSISYSTIRSMGGEISAQNTESGLKVSISLPLCSENTAESADS